MTFPTRKTSSTGARGVNGPPVASGCFRHGLTWGDYVSVLSDTSGNPPPPSPSRSLPLSLLLPLPHPDPRRSRKEGEEEEEEEEDDEEE